ncbi:MAG: single-stranded-DNA-specific exonuclease RecJ [Streptococcaceae bacterium]|jgi:single-stranded-DNA-specific exonuclease|nr:single-stranded-DNA-specific exonuclease RecJ [Streptococcaceae bacterium]
MISPKYDWKLLEERPDEAFLAWAKKEKLDNLAAELLWSRGVRDEKSAQKVLHPMLDDLHDPFLLHDMDKAVARIRRAIEAGEKILIYGDYDADGMTAASIVKSALDEIYDEEQVQVYLPNRFTDGYGPNLKVYQYFIEKEDVTLLITVDNGVAGRKEIAWAASHGCDVVITDHHSLPELLPEAACAIVHPRHPEGAYPFDDLCGAGVAFKLACALLEYVPREMLDLVAIGTVADMVSLRLDGENRILVAEGLKVLRQTERVGLSNLMRLAGIEDEALSNLTEEDIGFRIAPRLNALGRLDDPNPAIELLCGWDEEETAKIADLIEGKNTERRALTDQVFAEAETMLTGDAVEVLWHENWHKGVLGIVAGRLLDTYHKPFVLLSVEKNGDLRGSARSTAAFNLFNCLDAHRELFIAFGGHAQAGGMTLTQENAPKLKQVMLDFIADKALDMTELPEMELLPPIKFDSITLPLVKSLASLAPYGMANPKPHFLVQDYTVTQARSMGQDNRHLRLKLAQDKTQIEAVYFGHGAEADEFEQATTELAVTLSTNSWNGETTVQLMVEDARSVGIALLDARSRDIAAPQQAARFLKNDLENAIMSEVLTIEEAPTTAEGLSNLTEYVKAAVKNDSLQEIIFKNAISPAYYLTGAGSREQYATLYKTIRSYKEFDVRNKLQTLADFVKLPVPLLIKMIQIFEELGFVTISDGIMTAVADAPHHEISESHIYQELEATVKSQKFWALAPVKDIYQTLIKEKP